jgi:hypothetical protein
MQNASKKSSYYQVIASQIAAYLPPSSRVFDAGGGLGDLAIWLSHYVEHVTVIEKDVKAVAAFRARCPQNVAAMLGDVFSYTPDSLYDALVLCFFGKPEQMLPLSRELTRGKTFVVQSCDTARRFSLDETAKRSITIFDLEEAIKRAGVPYSLEQFEVEHGQPFTSLDDAVSFFSFYDQTTYTPERVLPYLEETGDAAFPYYFSRTRRLGLMTYEAGRTNRA